VKKGPERIGSVIDGMGLEKQALHQALNEHEARWYCHHTQTELRRKADALNRPQVAKQCLRCGARVGNWLTQTGLGDVLRIPLWDDVVADDYTVGEREERADIFKLFRDDEQRKWNEKYELYIRSAEWKRRRALVLERAKYVCEGCGTARATEVHHLHYRGLQDELLWELRAVCLPCHEKADARRLPSAEEGVA
jgi:hypothetical protein